MQLIMTCKIIAEQMMKTLDLRPWGDLHLTSVVQREILLPNQCLSVLLCGLRKAWKEADFCSLDSGWERRAVVTTQSLPYGEDMKLEGWVKWGNSLCGCVYPEKDKTVAAQSCYSWEDWNVIDWIKMRFIWFNWTSEIVYQYLNWWVGIHWRSSALWSTDVKRCCMCMK